MANRRSDNDEGGEHAATAASSGTVASVAVSGASLRRPTNGELIRCLIRKGCHIEKRKFPVPVFRGADNEDGPLTHPHPPRLVGPKGGFVPNLDDFPVNEEAAPSTHQYFCRRLGIPAHEIDPTGPDGPVTSQLTSEKDEATAPIPITRADGGRRRRR